LFNIKKKDALSGNWERFFFNLFRGVCMRKTLLACIVVLLFAVSCGTTAQPKETVGMILVGPKNDGGWSQAHYDAMKRVEAEKGIQFLYVDKVNPGDRPNVSAEQVATELIGQGATLIIANSDDFKDSIRQAAIAHPEVTFIHASGDDVLTGKAPTNLSNIMGKMEYGKMIAGCAAALSSQTGKIAYVGPLINDETRRLVNAAYLGARYCWTSYRAEDPSKLMFSVKWIGFWFNIPGVTLDPTLVTKDFITQGYDVILSGIDTPEVVIEVEKAHTEGKAVKSIPYDFKDACARGPGSCIGVPYFNWYAQYSALVDAHLAKSWAQQFIWFAPDYAALDTTSGIGYHRGAAFDQNDNLDLFVTALSEGFDMWAGPLQYQDGSTFVAAGQATTDELIWYQTQLLQGIDGQSSGN
jgi:simple sugar transport system substrate-binding protein